MICLDLQSSTFTATWWLAGREDPIACHDVGIKSFFILWIESGVMHFFASTVQGKCIEALKESVQDSGDRSLRDWRMERAVCTQES
mmetsp:Transcript_5821/g.11678  ORF Transcript_5821/g.11678 Transcript_5821/m.11678 type:complete len:86 (+) Transcript_5821:1025-1282(+)